MSEQERAGTERRDTRSVCPACGTPHDAGDRYCAECGAALPTSESSPAAGSPEAEPAASSPASARDGSLWVLGAAPATVIGGGLLMLLLAAALLFIGQRDDTGTIVMLSICVTPLALLVMVIGIARAVIGTAKRG